MILYSSVQPGISLTAVLFVCFFTTLFGVLFNTSCITFITQIHFDAFDWKRSCRSSSTPKWQIMPTRYQYSKEQDISLVTMHSQAKIHSVLSTPNTQYAVVMIILVILLSPSAYNIKFLPPAPTHIPPPTFPSGNFLMDVQKNCRHLSHEAHHDEKHPPFPWSTTSLLSIFLKYMPVIICNHSARS